MEVASRRLAGPGWEGDRRPEGDRPGVADVVATVCNGGYGAAYEANDNRRAPARIVTFKGCGNLRRKTHCALGRTPMCGLKTTYNELVRKL